MRIETLYVSNFLGAQDVQLDMRAPVQLISGRNGAGKSSIRDAVALALTADLGRVGLKKDAAQLITTNYGAATVELKTSDGDVYGVTISSSGKITDSAKGRATDPTLPFVLDAQRFGALPLIERRAFLFDLCGIRLAAADMLQRLTVRVFAGAKPTPAQAARIERITPLLRSGFDAACKQAKANATEAKGAWRAITGETFGAEKAKTWRATVPRVDTAAAKELATELQHLDVARESWQQTIGKLQAEEQRRSGLRTKLPALQDHAAKIPRIEAKLATDTQQLADWEADLVKTQAAAGAGPRVGLVHDMAAAIAHVLPVWPTAEQEAAGWQHLREVLDAYEVEHGKLSSTGDAKAAARLPSIRQSRDLMSSAVANDKRDLSAAQQARAEFDSITTELAEVFDAAALADAREQDEKLKAQRSVLVSKLDAINTLKAQADAAEDKTKKAAAAAADVAAWDAIGDALAPDGIPGEILAEALGPINDRLASSAVDTDWPRVVIADDMTITAGGRVLGLLSESERWRAHAMLAEAISSISGTRLLVLDGADVLDLNGRAELFGWLDVLAETGEVDTALIFATLKAAPTNLPATIQSHWIERGVCQPQQLKEAA